MPNTTINLPQQNANDQNARLVEWLISDGAWVETNTAIVVMETSKATFDVESTQSGYLFHLCDADEMVRVGASLAVISDTSTRPQISMDTSPKVAHDNSPARIITKKAQELIVTHHILEADLPDLPVIRSEDIEQLIMNKPAADALGRDNRDGNEDPDSILQDETYQNVIRVIRALRKRMKKKFKRHVSTGDILHDRWELARNYGFGEGSSVYDSCLILGDVTLGKHCWVGPFTILDGNFNSLSIGDYTSVGSGAHIYTHHTIEQALTGNKAKVFSNPTRIGSCCFISPRVIIAPGSNIGNHCFVATASYVEGNFPDYSYIEGNPAQIVGRVEIKGDRAHLRRGKNGAD